MASLIEDLVTTLSQEADQYQALVEIASQKGSAIVKNDIEQVQYITEKEQEFISIISKIDKTRANILNDIALVINQDVNELTVKKLVEFLKKQPKEQQQLSEVHDQLKRILKRLVEINEYNRTLIQDALDNIDFSVNIMQSMGKGPELNNYNKGASNENTVAGNSIFDAKQ